MEKNTGASRFYHGLTARYNIYFNGLESYRMGVDKISSGHVDDFGDLLYVFEYSNTASAQLGAADMERAVQKASKLITLKSITARPEKKDNQPLRDEDFYNMKEYNRWVDDSYLLMAKARFYQRDFEQARATIVFNNDNTTDRDIRTEGSIWLSRIHAETGNYSEALRVLTETGNVEEMPVSLRAMYHTTHADILLRQKRLEEAIVPIEKAIETSRESVRNTGSPSFLARSAEKPANLRWQSMPSVMSSKCAPPTRWNSMPVSGWQPSSMHRPAALKR